MRASLVQASKCSSPGRLEDLRSPSLFAAARVRCYSHYPVVGIWSLGWCYSFRQFGLAESSFVLGMALTCVCQQCARHLE
jgi:hypothetical protein